MDTIRQRFNSFTKKIKECIVWTNYLDKDGYGSFYFNKKLRRAHRVGYYLAFGNIPKGMVIDHTCRNRACVNPSHLRCITKRQNSLENSNSVGAINAKKTFCKLGHPFNRKYGKQRYCSICQSEKTKRLRKKWLKEANEILC
jgi:hypothetical protein